MNYITPRGYVFLLIGKQIFHVVQFDIFNIKIQSSSKFLLVFTNMSKINSKGTRASVMTSFLWLYCILWTYFASFYNVSNFDFEQVNIWHYTGAWRRLKFSFSSVKSGFKRLTWPLCLSLPVKLQENLRTVCMEKLAVYRIPAGNFIFKVNNKPLEQGVKYVQS